MMTRVQVILPTRWKRHRKQTPQWPKRWKRHLLDRPLRLLNQTQSHQTFQQRLLPQYVTPRIKNISAAPPAYPHVKWIERFPLSAWTTAIDSIEKKLSTAQRLSKAMVTKGTPMPLAIPKPQSYVCSPKFQETRGRSRSPRRSRSNACMVRASVQSVSVMAASII